MRRLIILFLFLPVCLSAQKNDVKIFGKGWYLSLAVQAETTSNFTLTPYVTANDTLPRGVDVFGRPLPRWPDTVRLNGTETVYFREPGLQRKARREQAIFNLLGSIRLHYRTNDRMEFSLGFFYQPTYKDEPRTNDVSGLPNDFYYQAADYKETYGGLVGDFTYHLRKGKRLRPYLGLQPRFGIRHLHNFRSTDIFPGLGQEIDATNNVIERFRTNTIFDFDLNLLAGINYQLDDRLAVGIEVSFNSYLSPPLWALQVRYRLGNKAREERQR